MFCSLPGERESQFRIAESGHRHRILRSLFKQGAFISVAGLYDPFGIQYTVLQQVFRQMYGMTVYEYRTQVRMQEAKNLLLAGSLTVTLPEVDPIFRSVKAATLPLTLPLVEEISAFPAEARSG